MKLPAVAPVIKASRLAVAAKRNQWHGKFSSDMVEGQRITTLEVTRNDECLVVCYTDNAYTYGEYFIFDRRANLHCASVALEKLADWPDVIELFKRFPTASRLNLVDTYRRLPFDEHEDTSVAIMETMHGKQVYWYSHEYARLDVDVVLPPKSSRSKNYRIAPVGHRKIFHFMGQRAGFRSVILDTIIKVG